MWLENVRAVFCVDGRLDNLLFWALVNMIRKHLYICVYNSCVYFSLVYVPSSGVAWS